MTTQSASLEWAGRWSALAQPFCHGARFGGLKPTLRDATRLPHSQGWECTAQCMNRLSTEDK
jgi:hypothetical protein